MKNKKNVSALISDYGAFIALALLVVGLSIISPEFRAPSNFTNLLRQATFNGLIAFGMTCVILSDGIDLSVGSTFALSAIVCAEMIMAGLPAFVAILAALVVGTLLGVVSGLLVTKGRLQPFIATLITMTAYRGLAKIITDGKPISQLANNASSGDFFFKAMGKGSVLIAETIKIPIPAIILVLAFLIVYFVLNKTTFGRRIYDRLQRQVRQSGGRQHRQDQGRLLFSLRFPVCSGRPADDLPPGLRPAHSGLRL